MDLRQLKYFKTIVDEGNITKAAEILHMAQPPLSQQLKQLETELGTVLIKRYRQQWELTETGRVLYNHAVHMLQDIKEVKQEIQEIEEGTRGTLSIGISSSCVNLLPKKIKEFRREYPNVFVNIWKEDSFYLQKLLSERKIELSFMLPPANLEEYQVQRLKREPFVVTLPAAWANGLNKSSISLKEIINYPFLMLGPMEGSSIYRDILNEFNKRDFSPNIVLECNDIFTVLNFVALEIGISIIPKSEIHDISHQNISTLEIEDFPLFIEPAIVSLKRNRLTKAAEHFLNYFAD
ncbi:LysR family transcriptional regulator [Peribacillus asahii]|uniref:LysR family transcriptional regulator n=1 Tax=Peribacillus asahii TaxID=228899 RepID=UPI0038193E1A